MPQLRTTKPAGQQSTVPYFTMRVLLCLLNDIQSLTDNYSHPPQGTEFWALDLCGLRFPAKLCFSCQRLTNRISQGHGL